MGNDPRIDVWFGVSTRKDEDLVKMLCSIDEDGDVEVDGISVGAIYNCWCEENVGWGASVNFSSFHFVYPMSDIHPGDRSPLGIPLRSSRCCGRSFPTRPMPSCRRWSSTSVQTTPRGSKSETAPEQRLQWEVR